MELRSGKIKRVQQDEISETVLVLNEKINLCIMSFDIYEKHCSSFINAPITVEDILRETNNDALNLTNNMNILCVLLSNIYKSDDGYLFNKIKTSYPEIIQKISNILLNYYTKLYNLYNARIQYMIINNLLQNIITTINMYLS